jgi:hypothetical protein
VSKLSTRTARLPTDESSNAPMSTALAPLLPSCGIELETVARPMIGLFQAVDALRTVDRSFMVQFLSPNRSAGTTTMASGFARAAAAALRRPVLYVDATPSGGLSVGIGQETVLSAYRKGLPPGLMAQPWAGAPGVSWSCLAQPLLPTIPLPLDEIEIALRLAQDAFALVVVDSASLEELPQSAALARICDGTVIVLDMRRAARRQAAGACETVRRLGGQVIGATVNRYRRNVPRWLDPIL